ncbi:MAG: class I SAM-dependent methyltransferase, partial [Candidatus Dormibacteria bacterium]
MQVQEGRRPELIARVARSMDRMGWRFTKRMLSKTMQPENGSRRCPFCEETKVAEYVEASERMFGLGGIFVYRRCGGCGSLYLGDSTIELATYYPESYYSYASATSSAVLSAAQAMQARMRALFCLRFLRRARVGVGSRTRFVDVGSGAGELLRALRGLGFRDVRGIDPFLRADVNTSGVPIFRSTIEEVANEAGQIATANVIMFHHSLEHVFSPASSLRAAERLLCRDGVIIVRIPVVNYAWERYRENWVGLDAPRHLSIPTQSGFEGLVARLGLRVAHVAYDSTAMQFVASEAYERGLTLTGAFPSNPPKTIARMVLSAGKSLRAKRLNRLKLGDQAAFA